MFFSKYLRKCFKGISNLYSIIKDLSTICSTYESTYFKNNTMELTINLLPTKKSKFRMGFGILVILFAGVWISFNLAEHESLKIFDWLYFIVLISIGIGHLLEGTSVSLVGLFGSKAFIHMNDDEIHFKYDRFKKGRIVKWCEIKSLEYKAAQYKITKTDNSIVILEIPTDSYNKVQSIKQIIESIASENGIQVA